MFWINTATMAFVGFLVLKLHRSLSKAKAGSTRSDMFLLYPDYMAVLVVYFLVCLGTVLVLGVQGPYPKIPNWFYQAQYVNALSPPMSRSVMLLRKQPASCCQLMVVDVATASTGSHVLHRDSVNRRFSKGPRRLARVPGPFLRPVLRRVCVEYIPCALYALSYRYIQDTPSTTSSVLYFLYWFLFEVGCTGFAMLFTHAGPSTEAFVSTIKYAVLWGTVAGGVKVRWMDVAGALERVVQA